MTSSHIEQLILHFAKRDWQKTAMIIGKVLHDREDKQVPVTADEIFDCLAGLCASGKLESQGSIADWRHCEVRLPFHLSAFDRVESEIARACVDAKRERAEVTLIAISKTFEAYAIRPILAAGQRQFGENRVQEAKGKWPELQAGTPGVGLHLIGPLQSNKAKEAVALFDAIHSVDRPSLCAALQEEIAAQGRAPQLFVQLNTGEEPQKAGIPPQEADSFLARCRDEYGLTISGLMCIPPVEDAPAPHFALTAKIAKRNGLSLLSMGMSADFAIAIRFGATHIRVGSAIFGGR